ncbi:MAG: hypothetical protein ACI93T_003796 [Porticoccaceae bacterium]|jgi:hypothetical protein
MSATILSVDIHATSEEVFDLIHDYSRRLDWDSFLRTASLLNGARVADVGVSSRCVARLTVGGLGMDTVYATFSRPTVAAVSMTRGPWFLRSFAASIRHDQIEDGIVCVTYRYSFKVFPGFLAFLIEPAVQWAFRRETLRRLAALKDFVERRNPTCESTTG